MGLQLFYHPFASFCQKVLIALYENATPFEPVLIDLGDAQSRGRLEQVWPLAKFPVLRDDTRGATVPESSLIIDHLQRHYPGDVALIPADGDEALQVHLWDRVFDNYVATQLTKVVTDCFRSPGENDPVGVEQAKATIAKAYGMIEDQLAGKTWICGEAFGLADCAAAPALFYSNTAVPLAPYPRLAAYYRRLLERPSFARVIDEARPYRHFFPLEWPADYT